MSEGGSRKPARKAGRMIRPEAVVLSDTALVPDRSVLKPPPNQFTHELSRTQPYYFDHAQNAEANGELAAGTRVVLMVYDGAEYCRVIDAKGLYVDTAYAGLRRL
jgi:hypothetical protein